MLERGNFALAELFTQPFFELLFVMVGMVFLYLFSLQPKWYYSGLIGIISFGLYFWSHYVMGYVTYGGILLFLFGCIAIMIEFILPTFGLVGIIGFFMILYSLVSTSSNLWLGIVIFFVSLIVAILVGWYATKRFNFTPAWKKWFVLDARLTKDQGYSSNEDYRDLLGKVGITITPLRPSGFARFGDQKIDVVSEGEIIPANEKVKVIHVEGRRVMVRKVDTPES